MEWISVKDQLPENFTNVYVKTDCEDCPIVNSFFYKGLFIVPVVIQCDKHYETDEKFEFISSLTPQQMHEYANRITHWTMRPEVSIFH